MLGRPRRAAPPTTWRTPRALVSSTRRAAEARRSTSAAVWTTASQPASAAATAASSVMSPTATSRISSPCGSKTRRTLAGSRTSRRTSCPAARSARALCDPVKPVPPVTSTFTGDPTLRQGHGQARVDPVGVGAHALRILLRELVARRAREELLEADPELEAREARAEAEVHPEAEGEVRVRVATRVEAVGLGEGALVAIRGGEEQVHALAPREPAPVQLDVARERAREPLHGRVVAQRLLDGGRDAPRVVEQEGARAALAVQDRGGVSERGRRGLDPSEQQQEAEAEDLVRGERLALLGRREQEADEVVARARPALVDDGAEVGVELPLRRLDRGGGALPVVHDRLGPAPEGRPVRHRNPEELRHHEHRERLRVARDEVDRLAGGEGVEERSEERRVGKGCS